MYRGARTSGGFGLKSSIRLHDMLMGCTRGGWEGRGSGSRHEWGQDVLFSEMARRRGLWPPSSRVKDRLGIDSKLRA